MRNIPGIAFSATNLAFPYTNLTNTTNSYTYAAELSVELVNKIAKATPKGQRIFPLGYGLNVDYPALNASCLKPPFVQSRFTRGGGIPALAYNTTTGLFVVPNNNFFGLTPAGENTCYNGDCSLPGESIVVTACESAVTIFTVDYDAPINPETKMVEKKLGF
jgi:5'-nucleotidase